MAKTSDDFSEIKVLDLSKQSLKTVPENIVRYTNLKELNLSNNQITVLPTFLKELKFLEIINVSENQLLEFPPFLFEMKGLKELNISENKIQNLSLSSGFKNILTLEVLNIGANPLIELPSWLWKLENLKKLRISDLNLKGLPVQIGNLRALEVLSIYNCKLTSLPDSIGYLENLKELYVKKNLLNCTPHTFGKLHKLEKLSFKLNKFDKLPDVITRFNHLKYLEVSENRLTEIPYNIGDLKSLKDFNISNNKIKKLPPSFYKIKTENFVFKYKNNSFSRGITGKIRRMFHVFEAKSFKERVSFKKTDKKEVKGKVKENEEFDAPRSKYFKRKTYFKKTTKKEVKDKVYGVFGITIPKYIVINVKEAFNSGNAQLVLFAFLIPVIIFLTFTFLESNDSSSVEDLLKKPEVKYLVIEKKQKERFNAMLEKTKEVYVYTNYPSNIELTLKANSEISDGDFLTDYDDHIKAKAIDVFLNNKSYGYNVSLNKQINFMKVYDSVIPNTAVKKFRLLSYYKIDSEEITFRENKDKFIKRATIGTASQVLSVIVDYDELKEGRIRKSVEAFFMPRNINLKGKETYFYFTPYNANVSKKVFLDAVEKFNKMYIEKGNSNKYCSVKTISVHE